MRQPIFHLEEDFDTKEDLVAIQQKINRFQKTIFHKKSPAMIVLAFRIENFKPKSKLQALGIAIKSFDLKIISGKSFLNH